MLYRLFQQPPICALIVPVVWLSTIARNLQLPAGNTPVPVRVFDPWETCTLAPGPGLDPAGRNLQVTRQTLPVLRPSLVNDSIGTASNSLSDSNSDSLSSSFSLRDNCNNQTSNFHAYPILPAAHEMSAS